MVIQDTIRSVLPAKDGKINWRLLLFLVLVLNVKLIVKVFAILLFTWMNRRALPRVLFTKKFIIFYAVMAGLGILNLLLQLPGVTTAYLVVVCTGAGFWLLGGLSAGINTLFVNNNSVSRLHATLAAFFIINAAVTIVILVWIMFDAGAINPYTYQGQYQKYFISTGDRMTGLSFDTSTTNALINAFAIVYFLARRRFWLVLLCMTTLVLTGSNLTNILVIAVLLYLFIGRSDRLQKSVIIVCLTILVVFLVKVSPQNNHTTVTIFKRIAGLPGPPKPVANAYPDIRMKPDSMLTDEEKRQKHAKLYLDSIARAALSEPPATPEEPLLPVTGTGIVMIKPVLPKADIHSAPYQLDTTRTAQQERLVDFARQDIVVTDSNTKAIRARKTPGKLIAWSQTVDFFRSHPGKLVLGTGMGRFSSKLAFRATGLQIAGGFPAKYVFIDDDFRRNHLALFVAYYIAHKELHSLIHTPNSVYDQLVSEYGIAGCIAFIFFYLAFFLRGLRRLTYGVPLILLTLGALAMDYWFEQLSIIILFEMMMLLDKKENGGQDG